MEFRPYRKCKNDQIYKKTLKEMLKNISNSDQLLFRINFFNLIFNNYM